MLSSVLRALEFALVFVLALIYGVVTSFLDVLSAGFTVIAALLGLASGLVVVLFVFPLIPGAVDALTNRPNRYRPDNASPTLTTREYPKSRFGFFTYLYPGQVKIIERGGRFIRCIMAFDHHRFKGEGSTDPNLTPKHAEHWEVVKGGPDEPDSDPIPMPTIEADSWYRVFYYPLSLAWWGWKRWVYRWTGAVFTGIPPFQTVKVYPMERFKKVQKSNGTLDLVRVEDYSDHYRVAHFQYPTIIPEADTKDKLSVRVTHNAIGNVANPYMASYNTDDDWPTRFTGALANATTTFTRAQELDKVLSAEGDDAAKLMAAYILAEANESTRAFGIVIQEDQILDISPSSDEVKKKIDDEAISHVDMRADQNRAKGKAAYPAEIAKALKENADLSPAGLVLAEINARVEIAKAAGAKGNLVVLGAGGSDQTQAAILQELRSKHGSP